MLALEPPPPPFFEMNNYKHEKIVYFGMGIGYVCFENYCAKGFSPELNKPLYEQRNIT